MTVEEFAARTADVAYVAKGMFYSELYLFLERCERARVNYIIESGVRYGMSTRLLAAAFDGRIVSVDLDRTITPPPRVEFHNADARDFIPALLRTSAKGDRIGVLIDGPKGKDAYALRDFALTARRVRVIAIHDVKRPGHGEQEHSLDPAFRARAHMLDARIPPIYRRKWPDGHGIAIWERA
jgi:predicted O-methyltransferase YrrM